jgi:hypothetical protein
MARMGIADGGDLGGVAGGGEPVADGGADGAAFDRPLGARRLAGDQQQQSRAFPNRAIEAAVEQIVGVARLWP